MNGEIGPVALTWIVLVNAFVLLRLGRWVLRLVRAKRVASALVVVAFASLIVALPIMAITSPPAPGHERLFEAWFTHWVLWAFLWLLAAPFLLMIRALEYATQSDP